MIFQHLPEQNRVHKTEVENFEKIPPSTATTPSSSSPTDSAEVIALRQTVALLALTEHFYTINSHIDSLVIQQITTTNNLVSSSWITFLSSPPSRQSLKNSTLSLSALRDLGIYRHPFPHTGLLLAKVQFTLPHHRQPRSRLWRHKHDGCPLPRRWAISQFDSVMSARQSSVPHTHQNKTKKISSSLMLSYCWTIRNLKTAPLG